MNIQARLASAVLLALSLSSLPANLSAQSNIKLVVAKPLLIVRDAEHPVQVDSVAVTVEVSGGLARTTIEMGFHNPNGRRLEGELQFPLEPGQQVSGFALDVDGRMRAAVPVPKEKGQDVFEAVERRGVDPGLLEQTSGNQFRLRIYPIPANGERHVRISIDQSLQRDGDAWKLRLPLAFARGLDRVPLRVVARGQDAPRVVDGFVQSALSRHGDGWTTTLDGRSEATTKGLELRFAAARQPQAFVQDVDGERYFHVEVPLAGGSAPRAMPRTIGLLWDSSASGRKRDIDGELALLDRYFAMVRNGEVRLVRLRDVAEPERRFVVRDGDWSKLRRELRATVYDGASALADWKPQPDVQEYLLVSDGFANYGVANEMPRLAPGQRLYAIDSVGANADATRLAAWADARGGRLIAWQGASGIADAASQLTTDGSHLVAMEGRGASDLVAASRFPEQDMLRIAGRLLQPAATVTLVVDEAGRERRIAVPVLANVPASDLVAGLWASYTVGELSAEPVLHEERIRQLGTRFGLVGPSTSLIVLENAADYVRYRIAPPAELRSEVARLEGVATAQHLKDRTTQIDKVRGEFAEKLAWWEKPWPKDATAKSLEPKKGEDRGSYSARADAYAAPVVANATTPMALPAPSPPAAPSGQARSLDRVVVTGSRIKRAVDTEPNQPVTTMTRADIEQTGATSTSDVLNRVRPETSASRARDASARDEPAEAGKTQPANIGIAMQAWKPDSPFARRLRDAKPDQVYAVYLDERAGHADSAAFYLDVADILFERGQRDLALRVLSNLAEMNLENRQLLRVLGYRLMQAHADALAVPVFEHVSRLADNEPQSWRDLGLAYAAVGREQDAIDSLYKVVTGTWDSRFPSVELIALGELDAIVARSRHKLDTRAIDPRLLRNLPLDLRVVLSWDSDNTDIDLWVTDPNGEKTFYGAPHSYQGGWLSHDCTQGYGPEEFILRNAKPGKYKVEANFFGDHEQLITGPTTLQVHLFTGFGTSRQKDEAVTLRLKDAKDTVLVGDFEVK